jgi:undecaprenyl-diphosphatase
VAPATAVLCLSVWAALLGMVLTREGLAEGDSPVLGWLVGHRTSGWTAALEAVSSTAAAGSVVLLTAGTALAISVRRRSWRPVATVGLAGVGAGALAEVLKAVVARPRPATTAMLGVPETGWGFPSAHTLVTSALAAAVALVVWRTTTRRAARALAVLAAGTIALAMGASRLYLGDHWFTDVLASYALAGAVTAVVAWLTGEGTAVQSAWAAGRRRFGSTATAAS